jgi:hypothetical protein
MTEVLHLTLHRKWFAEIATSALITIANISLRRTK